MPDQKQQILKNERSPVMANACVDAAKILEDNRIRRRELGNVALPGLDRLDWSSESAERQATARPGNQNVDNIPFGDTKGREGRGLPSFHQVGRDTSHVLDGSKTTSALAAISASAALDSDAREFVKESSCAEAHRNATVAKAVLDKASGLLKISRER